MTVHAEAVVSAEWEALRRVNSACAQNEVAVVRRVAVRDLRLSRLLDIARLSGDARAYLEECTRWREEAAGPIGRMQAT